MDQVTHQHPATITYKRTFPSNPPTAAASRRARKFLLHYQKKGAKRKGARGRERLPPTTATGERCAQRQPQLLRGTMGAGTMQPTERRPCRSFGRQRACSWTRRARERDDGSLACLACANMSALCKAPPHAHMLTCSHAHMLASASAGAEARLAEIADMPRTTPSPGSAAGPRRQPPGCAWSNNTCQ